MAANTYKVFVIKFIQRRNFETIIDTHTFFSHSKFLKLLNLSKTPTFTLCCCVFISLLRKEATLASVFAYITVRLFTFNVSLN